MKRQQWTTEDWKKVLWTDESEFDIFLFIMQFLDTIEYVKGRALSV